VLEPGGVPPPFTLEAADGRRVSLADFRGRDIVVYFYPADDTPGCTKEACGFRDAWDELAALNVAVLGVSPDSGPSHRAFAAKYRLPFTLLSDPDHAVMRAYGAYGEKTLYGRKVTGVIRSTVWIGRDGRVRRHWTRVPSAAGHPAKVVEAIRAA
jgi:thioredoxin-dependent peroxiredoxin